MVVVTVFEGEEDRMGSEAEMNTPFHHGSPIPPALPLQFSTLRRLQGGGADRVKLATIF